MKFSKIINFPLGLLGLKLIRKPTAIDNPLETDNSLKDIQSDDAFSAIYDKVKAYTMVSIERCYTLYQSVNYIIKNNISGDFVECGVWRGGSAMLVAYTLLQAGATDRIIFLYDTFEGMVKPGEKDGEIEKKEWEKRKAGDDSSNWCISAIEEVQANMRLTGYPDTNIRLVKGKVEETIPKQSPAQIALLRLDTDWYESTRHELLHLFPLLEKKGVLIIDDYGAWEGAKKATDEYFASQPIYLSRIDWTGRLLIK